MDFKIPPILTSKQLLDKAFKKASKIDKRGNTREESTKKMNSAKLNSVAHTLEDTLKRYEEEFPSIDILPKFYNEIIEIMIGVDKLKKSLGAVNWARRRTKRILMESARNLMKEKTVEDMEKVRKQAYGRTSSIIEQIEDDLVFLDECRKKLNSLPDIRSDLPTVVVAGYPNVGKSLLVSKISSGKPKVAVYPFTTKEVGIGHFMIGRHRCQLLDTPGLLDRPDEERNEIEKQAVNALESLADLILYIYDPTGTCGYPLKKQESLASELKHSFPGINMVEIYNKADIDEVKKDHLHISALEETNLDKLKGSIKDGLQYRYELSSNTT